MKEQDRVWEAIQSTPNDVLEALQETNASQDTIRAVALAIRRTSAKRASNRTTDTAARKTISARLPGREVAYYRALADQSHRSLYQFVRDALEAEARKTRADLESCQQLTLEDWLLEVDRHHR